ncbi:putative amino acid permease [Leishmania mexicana MHOM/GT/2001/U1103]|uniref:Amino acid permease n=1 Tax=Leishmania mexicana (strain MHOM/GT/2001/U1103) TaxID=929439 RepID=E9APM5_LEIMU|nr:putative amino acid permease [Leishmania mexicana MHOM/GT/2001/U1103]CBZ24890.1 putative amino acid permease [Leishmania mexicana MHOM/GT/2001/U1103]
MRHARERGAATDDAHADDSDLVHAPSKTKDVVSVNGISLGCGRSEDEKLATSANGKSGRSRRHVEAIFHPELRRTKEVIRRPEWVRRAGECVAHRGSLSTIALFGIMFANCVGGGYGFEDGIGSAGPLITLVVCGILPWMWAFPTGLAVAELSTAVPSNSGVLMWANAAFPPFVSFMCILATIFITFIGNATYPNLTAEYAQQLGNLKSAPVAGVKVGVVALCCMLNCIGVEIVGNSSLILCAITILPFSLLTVIQLFSRGFNKAVLYVDVTKVKWAEFFSIISWNYANIENAGAVVEEVANPRRALPKAMMMLMLSTYVGYVMPMLAGVSAMGIDQDYSKWKAGHWPEVAKIIAGDWLKYMLFAGALLSGIGFTLTSMCCTSRLLAGMGTMQMFPKKVSRVIGYYHPRLGTPIPAILINSLVTLVFSVSMEFTSVVSLCQSIYCLRMLLIYASLVKLRIDYPDLPRPYALPFSTCMTAIVLLPAAAFSLMASIVSAMTSLGIGVALVGFVVVGSGVSWLYCRIFARNGFQGVIVQCEVSSGDDAEAGAGDGVNDSALSEGVFYADEERNSGETVDDLLLGILPMPLASPEPFTPTALPRGSEVSPSQLHVRRGMTDREAIRSQAGEELIGMEYTPQDGPGMDIMFVNNSATAHALGCSAAGCSPTSGFPTYRVACGAETTMRHRHRVRSHGAGGDGGGTTNSSNYGPAVSGEESGEETDITPAEHSGGGFTLSATGLPGPVLSTAPPQLMLSPQQILLNVPAAGSWSSSRSPTPVSGRRSPILTGAINMSTTRKPPPPPTSL